MSGEEAFEMMFGKKDTAYPEEMKQEFVGIYDRAKAAMKNLREERRLVYGQMERPDRRRRPFSGRYAAGSFRRVRPYGRSGVLLRTRIPGVLAS